MYSQKAVVNNQIGICSRPATIFVHKASEFSSSIYLKYGGVIANGKSFLGIMSRSVPGGAEIEISAEGPDEMLAVQKLVILVESGFSDY